MIDRHIPFNKPYLTGNETKYITEAVNSGKISGNGIFTQRCQLFFEERYGFQKCLLTTSCTDALEMCAILLDLRPGDEVILPSYTFVSTANAFVLRGAELRFADSYSDHPNIDPHSIPPLITKKTKAIIVVHYAGFACDMDAIVDIAQEHGLYIVEDAAQAIESKYRDRQLGSFGDLATFSFHETKNIISGEGGMLVINNPKFIERSEIIWEKGTNRSAFFRGDIDKYSWVDIGSSYLPSEVISAFLYAQLECLDEIQIKRKLLWEAYYNGLIELKDTVGLPVIPPEATINGHLFYLVTKSGSERDRLINYLNQNNVNAVFHYLSLHKSSFFLEMHHEMLLPNADRFTDSLLRLPLFFELTLEEVQYITGLITRFYD